jgi:uncharacterized protein (DUF342 family)
MVTLEQLKDFMRHRAEEDRTIKSVTVSAATLEAALASAAVELGLTSSRVEYDVVQKGSPGALGMGRKAWTILAYEAAKKVKKASSDEGGFLPDLDTSANPASVSVDGRIFVRLWSDGVYLKITAPQGAGQPTTEEQALETLHSHGVRDINRQVVKGAVKLRTGTYGKVGEYNHNPANDTLVNVNIEEQEMRATVTLTSPGMGGGDASREDLETQLRNSGVVFGWDDDAIDALMDEPVYSQRVVVAQGAKPVNGDDAKVSYFFDTSLKIKPKEIEGRVDFKELNTIRNVLKGEELAKKEPARKGLPGRTVTGRVLPAKDGRDLSFELGNNVTLSRDGLRVVSAADGQVMLLQGKITVETVMVVPGDVDTAVGNINFLGSVIVKGSVLDGFTVKAVGNIEVMGNVGKAVIETHADVIVHQGVNGGGEGRVSAGQTIWSKFIQNATADAGLYVIVSDGILHSRVVAGKKILCKGKRAKIVGGYLRASEEINASSFGAVGSGETVLEVGIDPKVKEAMVRLNGEIETLSKEFNSANLNLQSLLKQERVIKVLPPEKQAQKKALTAQVTADKAKLAKATEALEKFRKDVDDLQATGKISSSGLVYPGAKVIIKDVELDIIREYNGVTFVRDGSLIRTVKYEEIEDEEIVTRS